MNDHEQSRSCAERWTVVWRVLLFWLVFGLVPAALGPLTAMAPRPWRGLILGLVTSLIMAGVTVLLARRDGVSLRQIGIAPGGRSAPKLALGFFAGVLLVALHVFILSSASVVHLVRTPETGLAAVMITLATYLAASTMEELGFRGYPLQRVRSVFGLWIAQAIVALVFAIWHVLFAGHPWVQALVGTGAGSLLFGMAAVASRGLAFPIGLHAAWNFAEWMAGGKGVPGFWKIVPVDGDSSGTVGNISYLAVMGAGTLACYLWYRKHEREPP